MTEKRRKLFDKYLREIDFKAEAIDGTVDVVAILKKIYARMDQDEEEQNHDK